ncbi:hypothetical protein E1301_Tti019441 [Triplophysa tibetana]|uniref:Uncharacterized protein n=1 Tax=Triplophysa tibetana TaxID=1572043 RepID=A0A5A9PI39_9TELE|nr:hypothetical protein E1301_Tti019441 [Triplophysa tibetana]
MESSFRREQGEVEPFTAELQLVSGNSVPDILTSLCSLVEVNRAVSVAISSVGTLSDQALCALRNDISISSVTLQQLHIDFGQILKSAMDLSTELDPQTNVDVAALFWGNLDEETIQNQHLLEFWLYLKFLPVLPYIHEQYLTQLSQRNFTCENFQMIVKVLKKEGTLVTDTQHQAFFTHLIYAYLSRRDTPDPGCLSNVSNNTEWLHDNLGMCSGYATLTQLQALNRYFANFDSLSLLSPSQAAELTQDSEALNSVNMINMIFAHLEEGDVFRNADEFFATLTQSKESLCLQYTLCTTVGETTPEFSEIWVEASNTSCVVVVHFPHSLDEQLRQLRGGSRVGPACSITYPWLSEEEPLCESFTRACSITYPWLSEEEPLYHFFTRACSITYPMLSEEEPLCELATQPGEEDSQTSLCLLARI